MKQIAVNLSEEAVDAGARRHQACDILGISCRTLLRWQAAGDDLSDKRRQTNNRNYTYALTQEKSMTSLAYAISRHIKACRLLKSCLNWLIRGFILHLNLRFTES